MAEQKSKRVSKKPLLLTFAFLVGFGLFAYFLTRETAYSKAMSELKTCYSKADIRKCWDKYKSSLNDNDDFLFEVRQRLQSLNITDEEIKKCKAWLPKPPTSLNVILVPDLSKRIVDVGNNPNQIQNDTLLLNEIWDSFRKLTRTKMNSKDRLIVDVTDNDQAGGQFRTLADNLIFDLSTHKDKSNRLYFDMVGNRFSRNIHNLYLLAKQKPIGADYWFYFNRGLSKKLQKSTLFDDYRNVVIIITDGYLEAQNNAKTGVSLYTGSFLQRSQACNQLKRGVPILAAVQNSIFNIRDCQEHFPELEILVLEVNERSRRTKLEPVDPGTACDYDILKSLWMNWFKMLEIKNANENFFIQRNDAIELTKKEIKEFLELN